MRGDTMEGKDIKKNISKKMKVLRKKLGKTFNMKQRLKKGFRLEEVIILIIIASSIGIFSGVYIVRNNLVPKDRSVEIATDLQPLANIYNVILDNFYNEVNKEELINGAIEGMISALDDPHTIFLDKDEKKTFDERMQGEYFGIGVELLPNFEGEGILIPNVFEGSPAEAAGIKNGDIIIALDDTSIIGMTPTDVAKYIKEGDEPVVNIKVRRNDEEMSFNIAKERITLKSVTTKIFQKNNKKVGYVKISVFANNTYDQFREAILKFEEQKIDSLIIDVRNNAGGYLNSVERMVSMFLEKDKVIYQIQANKEITRHYDLTEEHRTYPVAILINRNSASASEILAAAFKEVYNSQIIGVKTYGKGTVQEARDLINGGMIKITTQKWLTPSGNLIEKVGITPTIELELSQKYIEDPRVENDNQLQKAIEVLIKK
jgi:carboxyl-terminal processing protease